MTSNDHLLQELIDIQVSAFARGKRIVRLRCSQRGAERLDRYWEDFHKQVNSILEPRFHMEPRRLDRILGMRIIVDPYAKEDFEIMEEEQ